MKKGVARLLHILLCTSAVLLLALSVFASFLHFLTPALNQHKDDFEAWVKDYLGMSISITNVSLSWYRLSPTINLNNVTVFDPKTQKPFLYVKQVSAITSVISSLWQRKPVLSGFMVKGTTLEVHQEASGWVVHGFPQFNELTNQEFSLADTVNAFSKQENLLFNDVQLNVHFNNNKNLAKLHLDSVQVINNGDAHTITAKVLLHHGVSTTFNFQANWYGANFDLSKIRANVYLDVSKLPLMPWLKEYEYQGFNVLKGILSVKSWLTWKDGGLQLLQSQFQLYDTEIQSKDKIMLFRRLSGELGMKRNQQELIVAAKDLLVDTDKHYWPATGFYAVLQQDASSQTYYPLLLEVADVDISEVQHLALMLSRFFQENDQFNYLKDTILSGRLYNIRCNFLKDEHWTLDKILFKLANLSVTDRTHSKKISGVSGLIEASRNGGMLALKLEKGEFYYAPWFKSVMPIDASNLNANWIFNPQESNWRVQINELSLQNNPGVSSLLKGSVLVGADHAIQTDLQANFSIDRIDVLKQYLPDRLLSPKLGKWLHEAFLKGSLKNGKLILQGDLAKFPFHDSGQFLVTGDVRGVDLFYAEDWPVVAEIDGSVTFSGEQLKIHANRAITQGVRFENIDAFIPSLINEPLQRVEVQAAPAAVSLRQASQFVMQSPLHESFGDVVSFLQPKGNGILTLQFTVPLEKPDKATLNIGLNVQDANLQMPSWRLPLEHVNGQFVITENGVNADKVSASLFDKPIAATVTASKIKGKSNTTVSFKTNIAVQSVEEWLKLPSPKQISGEAAVSGEVVIPQGEMPRILLHSDLLGVAIDVDKPYGKMGTDTRQTDLTILPSQSKALQLRINYANMLSSAFRLQLKSGKPLLDAVLLRFGAGDAPWPTIPGLSITGSLDEVDWSKVVPLMSSSSLPQNSFLPKNFNLNQVNVKIKTFKIFNQTLNNHQYIIRSDAKNWMVDIRGRAVSGKMTVPKRFSPYDLMMIRLDTLAIASNNLNNQTKPVLFNGPLPEIIFSVNQFKYNDKNIGKLNFKTQSQGNDVFIRDLVLQSPNVTLTGNGSWQRQSSRQATDLVGSADSKHTSELLASLGYDVRNYILGSSKMRYKVRWQNAPFSPELKTMSGNVNITLGQGQIVGMKETSGAKMDFGRLLSLLSLQTLPRRLSLDFSDLFQRGYSFDSFKGDFNMNAGSVTTKDALFDGPVAEINIKGRIGFVGKDYDLTISMTPHLTSSVPVAAALFAGSPVIGVAALAANKVFSTVVSQATSFHYHVTGPWDNPKWDQVSAKQAR